MDAVLSDRIDLLVDGELGDEERASLLRRLAEEGRWRQCAERFLEAQAWRAAFESEGETAPAVRSPRSPVWKAPLAAVAAALLGFAVALFLVKQAPAATIAKPVAEVKEEIRLVPFPVVEQRGFVPVSDERGNLYYRTREDVPRAVLKALVEAGHDVQRVERVIDLPREDGAPLQLPITETRVVFHHEL